MNLTDHIRAALMPKAIPNGYNMPGLTLYGDSIMANGIATRLRANGIAVHDLSQPGDVALNAWRRFAYDIRSMGTVVLQHGTNDLSGGRDPVPYLRLMAERALAEGRRVIFTGITRRPENKPAYDYGRACIEIYALARSLNCTHALWESVPYSSNDKLHPDVDMADRLAAVLGKALTL